MFSHSVNMEPVKVSILQIVRKFHWVELKLLDGGVELTCPLYHCPSLIDGCDLFYSQEINLLGCRSLKKKSYFVIVLLFNFVLKSFLNDEHNFPISKEKGPMEVWVGVDYQ